MSDVTVSADEKTGVVVFSPTKQSKSSWQEECQEKMATYVTSSLAKENINVPKEAAAQAMSAVMKLQQENPSLVVVPNSEGTAITVAGELSSVSQAKELVEGICSSQVISTASRVLSPEDYDYVQQMQISKLPATIECTFEPRTFKILLKGPAGDVSKFQESLDSFMQHVGMPVMLEPQVTEFFKSEIGKGKLKKFLQERQCQAALHFNPHPNLTLHLLCKSEDARSVRAVKEALSWAVTAQAIQVPEYVAPILSDQLCQKVEKEHGVLIKHVGHELSAAGFRVEVRSSLAEINKFLKEKASPLPLAEMRVGILVAKSLHSNPRGIEKHLQSYPVQLQIDTSGGVVQFAPKHYLKPGWEESCKSRAAEYIHAHIAEVRTHVPQSANSDVLDVLYSSKQDDSTFVYDYPPHSTALAFAGDKGKVKYTEEEISKLCASYSEKNEEMPLSPEDFEFLHHFKMQDLISKYHPSVNVDPQPETHSLALFGTVKGVKEVKEYVSSLTAHATVPVALEQVVVKYLSTEKGKEKLYGFLREKRCDCAVYISESPMNLFLLCALKYKKKTETTADALQECTCSVPLQIPELLLPFLSELPDFTKEAKRMEKHNSVQISIEGKQLLVTGFKDGVSTSTETLSAFIKEKVVHFQPVHVPIDLLIAKCIEMNPVPFHACMAKMQVNCTIKAEKSTATVSISPTKANMSGWKEKCLSELTSYIETNYLKEEIEVPKPAESEILQDLKTKSKQKVFQYETCNDGSRVIVVGERSVVQAVQANVSNICNKCQTTEAVQLTDREYDFFTQVVQPQLSSAVTFEGISAKNTVVIGGSIRDVTDMKYAMKGMVRHSTVPVAAESVLIEFFTTGGKQDLESYVQKKGLHVAFHNKMSVHPPSLEFLCDPKLEESVRDLARALPGETKLRTIPLPKSLTMPPEAEEFDEHCHQLEISFRVLIRTTENQVNLCGFRDSVDKVTPSLTAFMKKKCSVKEPVRIQKGMWRLFSGPMKQEWMQIEAQCQGSEVEVIGDKSKVKYTEEEISKLCASYSEKNEEMPLSPEDFEFLHHFKMQDLISKYRPSVDVDPQPETHSLALFGTVKGVKEVKEYVSSLTAHATVPVALEQVVVKYLSTEKGKEKLYGFLREKRCDCAVYISESPMNLFLLCALKYKKKTETTADALQECTCSVPLQIPELLLPFLSELPDFTKEAKRMEKHNSVQISIEGKQLLVTGFKDGVSTSIDILSAFMKQKALHFQPLHVPIDPLIAKCITSNPAGLHACMANIQVKCEMKTEQSSAIASLSPTKATMSEWKEECQGALTSYIETNYSREEIEVPKPAASEVFRVLLTSSKQNVLQFELCNDGTCANIAGEKNVVEELQASITNICNEYPRTETVKLSGREYDFFTQVVQPQLKKVVTIECVPAKHSVVIGGSIREVTDMKNSMKVMVQHSVVPLAIESRLVEFFTTDGKQDLANYIQKKGVQVAFHSSISMHPPFFEFLCDRKLEPCVKDLAKKISRETQVSVMSIPESLITTSSALEFAEYCKQLKTQFKVSIKTNQNQLWICGFINPVIDAKKLLESYMEKKCFVRKTIPIPMGMWYLFNGPMKSKWMKVEVQCKDRDVELTTPVKEMGQFSILLKGDKVEVQRIDRSIAQLIQSVVLVVVPVRHPDLCKVFGDGEKGRIMIADIEKTHNVCIEVMEVDDHSDTTPYLKQGGQRNWPSEASKSAAVTQQGVAFDFRNRLTVEVLKGDITKERTDAIVNTTNKSMHLDGMGVAAALLKKAGQDLQKACDEARARGECLSEGKVIDTRPGKLKCKRVFHIVFHSNDRKVFVTIIRSCIERAIQLNFTSIAFPAIGTGVQRFPAVEAAMGMITALQQYCSPHTLTVRIVLFQVDVFSVFKTAFEDQVKYTSRWWRRAIRSILPLSSHPLPQEEEEIELRIYGETEENVRNADDFLNKVIDMQFMTEDYKDDKIGILSGNQEKVLREEAHQLQLVFDMDRTLKCIHLRGSKKNISDMKVKIVKVLNQAEVEARKKVEAVTLMKSVQWKRLLPFETPYDPLINLEIEKAYCQRKPNFVFKQPQSAENFTIDFKKMEETDHTMQNQTCRVKRVVEGK